MEQDLNPIITRINKLRYEFDDYSVADTFKDVIIDVLTGKFGELPETTRKNLKEHLDKLLTINHV